MVADMEDAEKTAQLLFATQDPQVCTFPEGYVPRQTVFACLTCTPAPELAGVCYGCSLHCHEDHNIIELYTKRKFKCDCGNSKFGDKKCTLYEEKDEKNEFNEYNHNYHGKFCTCDAFYPDEPERAFMQCELCEDWFHDDHTPATFVGTEEGQANGDASVQNTASMICSTCIRQKLPFIAHIPSGKDVFCHSKLSTEQLVIPEDQKALMISHFRKRLCKCTDCTRVYDLADCEYLMDEEDDMTKFDEDSKKAIEREQPMSEGDEMRELVRSVGMEGAQVVYRGLNEFKRKFQELIDKAGDRIITEADVKEWTETLKKRPRHE
ncbi:hypothetical protein GCK72_000412 [Caenorhabditis remanei]|uniref:UBR-type domain-containing protein n=1 Tax=Caenorhabditis remanei TaxID=31234 RepID=A0A6A5HK95_CAERE|nr:hypothetical protein GCK72_000412 [Caenorhabditis remanei]KAF1768600.1 hypothetical protein GCK72_000412 [Caenorhabditis remanei]